MAKTVSTAGISSELRFIPTMLSASPEMPGSRAVGCLWLPPNSLAGESEHPGETVVQINSHELIS